MGIQNKSSAGYSGLALLLGLAFILGMAKVWVNVERVDLAYRMERLQSEYRENREVRTKLTIERNNLLSQYRLREWARDHGLSKPDEKQIRKIRK